MMSDGFYWFLTVAALCASILVQQHAIGELRRRVEGLERAR